jgi:hypothetical protein
MFQRTGGNPVLVYREKIIPFLFDQFDLNIIDPEIEADRIIQVPAKLVVLDRGHNAQQTGVFKEALHELPGIQHQFVFFGHAVIY